MTLAAAKVILIIVPH